MLIYINFSFDFLGLDKVYFKNNFANYSSEDGSFLKPFKALVVVLENTTDKTRLQVL
jgi:hypothetical protein